ncbi:hypothetical protein QE152_g23443 [Popillia japonica]|uniref:Transposase n=1 Tax=Popillia japonica TaxID=7064 RepID=A0AAW1KH28_POPJA
MLPQKEGFLSTKIFHVKQLKISSIATVVLIHLKTVYLDTRCETVKDIINSDGRLNPFKDGLPGYKWFNPFLNRQPEVSQRHAESINTARASVSETSIRHWHEEIRRYLASENAEDILEDPTRIFNSDESGFATNPKSGLVLGLRGMKNFYEIKSGSEKECITALFTISADGQIHPPMIVYP